VLCAMLHLLGWSLSGLSKEWKCRNTLLVLLWFFAPLKIFTWRNSAINNLWYRCGHMCCCMACSSHLTNCPLCRRRIDQAVRTFRHWQLCMMLKLAWDHHVELLLLKPVGQPRTWTAILGWSFFKEFASRTVLQAHS